MTTVILEEVKKALETLEIDYNINSKNTHISVVLHAVDSDEKSDKSFRIHFLPMEPLNALKIVMFSVLTWKESEFKPELYEWVNKLNQDVIYGNLMIRHVRNEYRLTYTHGICLERGTKEIPASELDEIFVYIAFLISHIFELKKAENLGV